MGRALQCGIKEGKTQKARGYRSDPPLGCRVSVRVPTCETANGPFLTTHTYFPTNHAFTTRKTVTKNDVGS